MHLNSVTQQSFSLFVEETLAQTKPHLSFELLERASTWKEMPLTSGFKATEYTAVSH